TPIVRALPGLIDACGWSDGIEKLVDVPPPSRTLRTFITPRPSLVMVMFFVTELPPVTVTKSSDDGTVDVCESWPVRLTQPGASGFWPGACVVFQTTAALDHSVWR